MQVLLISVNEHTEPYPVYPLGLAYIAAALRQYGHSVLWHDLLPGNDDLQTVVTRHRPDVIGLSIRNIDDVQIDRQTCFVEEIARHCQELRKCWDGTLILGGSGFSIFPEQLMQALGADFGITGEGEQSLPALLSALEHGGVYDDIPGLVRRQDGQIIHQRPQRMAAQTLSSPLRPEDSTGYYLDKTRMLNVQTQRGCGLGCIYCTYPGIEGGQVRRRDPDMVAEEFSRLAQDGVNYVYVVDSVFNSSQEHVHAVCEALIKRGSPVEWGCFLRPKNLDPEIFRLMHRAGLRHAEFGSDSFEDSVLKAYGKDFTFQDILSATRAAETCEVAHCHFLICGGPGESAETLETTFRNSLMLEQAVIFGIVGMRVYPGTRLWRQLREDPAWRERDLLEPAYYITPDLEQSRIESMLQEFSERSPNWFVGDVPPAFGQLCDRLRQRGATGPLWDYLSVAARIRSLV